MELYKSAIRDLRKSFSSIRLIEGLLAGSFVNISANNYRRSSEYCGGIGG